MALRRQAKLAEHFGLLDPIGTEMKYGQCTFYLEVLRPTVINWYDHSRYGRQVVDESLQQD